MTSALIVSGWALSSREDDPVTRVDVLVDGEVAGTARLGMPRRDIRSDPKLRSKPTAGICGFEWAADPGVLAGDGAGARVAARVRTGGGSVTELPLEELVRPEDAQPRFEDRDGEARRLRERTAAAARTCRVPRCGEGLRLLAFTHRLDHGGAQRYFFEQVRYLMADPAVSCTVVAGGDGVWRRRLETIGADVHLVQFNPYGIADYESELERLAAWAAPRPFDVAFVNTLDAFAGADLAERLGLPVVWSLHESFPLSVWWREGQRNRGHPYVREQMERALAGATALVFAADATRRLYRGHAPEGRMLTAPYGLELADIDGFRRRHADRARRLRAALPADAVLVVCPSTVTPRKGQAVLAQGFARIAHRHDAAHLVLVGDTGDGYAAAVEDFVASSGLSARCTILPLTADPYSWHEVADLFVLASDVESSPISILEAMAFETPVAATGVFGVPELIEDGVHGYLCEPNDVESVARCLDRALSAGPAERRRVTRAAAARVRRRHDPERYAACFRDLLLTLARDPGAIPAWGAGTVVAGQAD